MILNYISLGVIFFLALLGVIAIVQLGSLPGKIAHRRGHPQPDAVNAASWISFLTLGALWPLAFVWAFFKHNESASVPSDSAKQNDQQGGQASAEASRKELAALQSRLAALEATVNELQPKS